jgi:NAD(P)H-dependent FMN reductase
MSPTTPGPATLLLVSGSLRVGSTNTSTLHTVQEVLADRADGATGTLYAGMGDLPHFNPDDDRDPLPGPVAGLRTAIAAASGLVFCTPEYAGDMPGSLKNLLDWTVGGVEIQGKPTAWINVSTSPTGAAGTHAALRTVLGYTGADIVDEACVHVPVPRDAVDPDGVIGERDLRVRIGAALTALLKRAAG